MKKTGLLVVVLIVGLILLFGCTDLQQGIGNAIKTNSLTKSSDYNVLSISFVKNCFGLLESYKDCSLIKVELYNNDDVAHKYYVSNHGIIYNDGTTGGLMTGINGAGLIADCGNEFRNGAYNYDSIRFSMLPSTKKILSLCFVPIDKTKEPNLYLTLIKDYEVKDGEISGGHPVSYNINLDNNLFLNYQSTQTVCYAPECFGNGVECKTGDLTIPEKVTIDSNFDSIANLTTIQVRMINNDPKNCVVEYYDVMSSNFPNASKLNLLCQKPEGETTYQCGQLLVSS